MIYYEAIVGSRSHNIELPESDWDFITCSDTKEESTYNKANYTNASHLIHKQTDSFFKQVFLENLVSFYPQVLFPYKLISETQLTDYLLLNREQIIRANSKRLYNTYTNYFLYILRLDKNQWKYAKKLAYACLYANLLIEYSKKDRSFEELFVVHDCWRDWLINVRNSENASDEHLKKFNELYAQIPGLEQIYTEREDVQSLSKFKKEVKELLYINT